MQRIWVCRCIGISIVNRQSLGAGAMRWNPMGWAFAGAGALILAHAAGAKQHLAPNQNTAHKQLGGKIPRVYIRSFGISGGVAYARRTHGAPLERGTGFRDLLGDPGTGLGFYALPLRYRIGAWRYRVTHRRPWRDNPVLFAIAADAARYNYWIPADRGYVYGVFNPYDGVGTPFFGGYYDASLDDATLPDLDGLP